MADVWPGSRCRSFVETGVATADRQNRRTMAEAKLVILPKSARHVPAVAASADRTEGLSTGDGLISD